MTTLSRGWGAAPLAALGGAGFLAVFTGRSLVVPVVAAALAGVAAHALTAAGTPERRPEAGRIPAAVALVLVGAAGALHSSPLVLLDGLRQGPRDILGAALPAPAGARSLAVPFLLTLAAGYLGAALARSPASTGTWWRSLLPAVPSLAVLVVGLSFGGADGLAGARWVAPLWAGLVLVTLAGIRPRAGSRAVAGALMAGVVVLVALPLSQVVPTRADTARVRLPRTAAPAPQPGQSNPLARVTAFHGGDDTLLFAADTSAPVARWRLAVLDRYDGRRWSSGSEYQAVGRSLPAPPEGTAADPASVARVEQTVELVAPPEDGVDGDPPWGRWLPVADRAVELSAGGVLFDAAGGTAVVPAGRPVPERYDVVSLVGEPDAGRLADARAADGDGEDTAAALRLPDDVPAGLRAATRQVTEGAASDYAAAAAIQSWLMGERFRLVTVDPPGGHTLGHLDRFVRAATGSDTRGPVVGSVEQFVATFAVMARLADLPSRVVVGFHGLGVAGPQEVRAHDATAWVEVELEGLGWVVFDPVPAVEGFVPDTGGPVASPDEASSPSTLPEANADVVAGDGDGAGGTGGGLRLGPWLVGGAVVLAALLLGGLAAPGLARRRRRARWRRRPAPRDAVVGSWLIAVDELRLAGVDTSPARAVSDVVGEGRLRLGAVAEPLVGLGALANRCRYAASAPVTDEHARRARELCDQFVAGRRRGRPAGQRLRELIGLRGDASRSAGVGIT